MNITRLVSNRTLTKTIMSNYQIFVTSDTHFGHNRVIEFQRDARPFSSIEEHDETLIDNWNSTVRPKDTVWHLGDAVFGKANLRLLGRLNGIKRLVMGNHDGYNIQEYAKYFSTIAGCAKFRGYILTHIPVHVDQFKRFRANIHGHLHSKSLEDPRYYNVGVDRHHLKPVAFDEIEATFTSHGV